ncbi:MAG: hypothetical protein NTY38_07575 [Acidobacteria bacterium]|nr:hypothetical protein [Acidobacteriota bacterium]
MKPLWLALAAHALLLPSASAAGRDSSGVQSTHGLPVLAALLHNPDNVVIPLRNWQLKGFAEEPGTVRVPYVRRVDAAGGITVQAPSAGVFYPGFIIYDSSGDERVSIRIDGVERGIAVARADDNREHLFFLDQPHQFRGGESIRFDTLSSDGLYRIEAIVLLRTIPAARALSYRFSHIFARPEIHAGATELTWITSWPTLCTVEWKAAGSGRAATLQEPLAVRNHRLTLPGLQPGRGYEFRLTAGTRDGRLVSSEWSRFRIQAPEPAPGTVQKARVSLHLHNPAQENLTRVFPVTSGLPFPKGSLGSDAHLRLLNPQGLEVPLQTRILATWPDQSVKWVLLDFQADPSRPGDYAVEYGRLVARKPFHSKLHVTGANDTITVSTGALDFVIRKHGPGLLDSLSISNGPAIFASPGIGMLLTAIDGATYSTEAPPDEVAVEESGPLRATIRLSGRYRAPGARGLFAYTLRLSAYAGQPFLRLVHSYGNDNGGDEFTSLRSLKLSLPIQPASASGQSRWTLGTAPEETGTFEMAAPVRLAQHADDRYTISRPGGAALGAGRRAPGWAEWSDGGRRITLAVRDFWETYPKAIVAAPGGLELDICPPLRQDEYAAAKGTVDEHRLYYYLANGAYKFRQGMSQTQDIWLEAESADPALTPIVRSQRSPLMAIAPPLWYSESKAFGDLAPPSATGVVARYDSAFAAGFEEYWKDRERDREYGMLNFGDWWGERGVDWGNSEYDTQNAFLLQFLRTGSDRYFTAGEQMEWHNRDVDTIQHHRDVSRIGGVYHHAIGHTGGYYAKGVIPGNGIAVGILTVDHVFNQGHLAYYFLTGDSRSLETAKKIAGRYGTYDTLAFDINSSRNAGWHLILTMAAYNATRDPFYLNAARIILERVEERQTPNGGWDYFRVCMHQDPPQHYGNFGFTVGTLLTGLRMYYEATGDEQAATQIVRGARWMAGNLYVPATGGVRYSSCPVAPVSSALTFLLLDGVAFAHQRTGDPMLRRMLTDSTAATLDIMSGLDPAAAKRNQDGMGTPHFLGYAAALERLP